MEEKKYTIDFYVHCGECNNLCPKDADHCEKCDEIHNLMYVYINKRGEYVGTHKELVNGVEMAVDYGTSIKWENCTPHEVKIFGERGKTITIPASSNPSRLEEEIIELKTIDSITIYKKEFKAKSNNIPEPKINTYYIVSLPIAQAFKNQRDDFFVPGELIRDEEGNIRGCKGLFKV